MNVLITGARLPASLEIARAFANAGHQVYTADTVRFGFSTVSTSVTKYIRIPSPVFDFKKFKIAILKSIETYNIELVIPVSEEIFFLARFAGEMPCRLFAPGFDLLKKVHSKVGFQDFTTEVPVTRLVQSADEAKSVEGDLVAKQEFSRGSIRAHLKPNDLSLLKYPLVVQQFIPGKELCTYSIASEGKVLAHVAYEPVYRYGQGASVYFRSIENARLLKFVQDYVARAQFTGQIAFDFIVNDQGLFALECNPRATSGVHLLNPHQIVDSILGKGSLTCAPAGIARSAKLTLLMTNFPKARDFFAAKDTSFSWSDPLPFLSQFPSGFEIAYRSLKWKMSAGHAFGYDLEWNGSEIT